MCVPANNRILKQIQDDLENNLPPLNCLPEVDLRKHAVTNPFDWRPVTRLRRYKHPKKYPIPVLDRLVQRHYKATRETQLGIDGEYKALMYMLIATLISPPYNKAVMVIDLAHEFDASEVLKHAPYTWRKTPMPHRPVPIRSKMKPRPRSNKRKAVRQLQRRGSGKKSKSKGIPPSERSAAEQVGTISGASRLDMTARPVPQAAKPSAGTAARNQDKVMEEATIETDDSVVKFEWVKPVSPQNTWDFSPAENARLQRGSKSRGKGVAKPTPGEHQGRSRTDASSGAVQSAAAQQEDELSRQARSETVPAETRQEMTEVQQHTSGEARILAQAWSREPVHVKQPMTQLQALRSVPRPKTCHVQAEAGRERQAQCASEVPASGRRKTNTMSVNQPEETPTAESQSSKVTSGRQTGIFPRGIQRPIVREPEPPAWNHGYYLQTPRQRVQRRTAARAGSKRKRSATSATDVTIVPLAKRLAELKRYRQLSVPVQSVRQVQPTPAPKSRAQLRAERRAAMLLERRAAVYAAQVKWAEEHEALLGEKQYPRWMPSASRLRGRDDIFDRKYPDNINKRWLRLAEGRFKIVRDTVAVPKHPPFHHSWMPRPETTRFWPAAKPRPMEDTTAKSSGRPAPNPEIQAKIDPFRRAAEARWTAEPNKEIYAAELLGSSSISAPGLGDAAGGNPSHRRPAEAQRNRAVVHAMTSNQQPPQPDMVMSHAPPAAQRTVSPQYSPNTKARIEANRRAAEEKYHASRNKLTTSSRASAVLVESMPKKVDDSEGMFALATTPRAQYSTETWTKVELNRLASQQSFGVRGSLAVSQLNAPSAEADPTSRHPMSTVKTRPPPEVLTMIEAKRLAARERFEAKGKYIAAQAQAEITKEGTTRPSVALTQEQPAPYVASEQDVHGGDGDEVYAEFEDSGEHEFDFDTMEGVILGSQDDVDRSQTNNFDRIGEAYDDEAELITGSQVRLVIERRLAARQEEEQSNSEIERPEDVSDEEEVLTGTQARLAIEQRIAAAREQERNHAVMQTQPPPDHALRQPTATQDELAVGNPAAHQRRDDLSSQAMPPPRLLESGLQTQHASYVQRTVTTQQSTIPSKHGATPEPGAGVHLDSFTQGDRQSNQTGAKRQRGDTKSLPRSDGAAALTVQHHGSEESVLPRQTLRAPVRHQGSEDLEIDTTGTPMYQTAAIQQPRHDNTRASHQRRAIRPTSQSYGSEDMQVDRTGQMIQPEFDTVPTTQSSPQRAVKRVQFAESQDKSNQQRSAAAQTRLANHLLVAKAQLARAKQLDHPAANTTLCDESKLPADLQEKIATSRVAAQRILAVNMGMEDRSVLSRTATRLKAIPQRLPENRARFSAAGKRYDASQKGKGKMAAWAKHDLPAEVQAKITALQMAARKRIVAARKRHGFPTINRRTAVERNLRNLHTRRAQEKLAEAKRVLLPADHAKLQTLLRAARRKILARRKVIARILAAAKHIARLPHNVLVKLAAPLQAHLRKLEAARKKTNQVSPARGIGVGLRRGDTSDHQQSPGLAEDESQTDGQSAAFDPETAGFLRACRDLSIYANVDSAKEALAQAPGSDENEAINWLLDKQARGDVPSGPQPDVELVAYPGPSMQRSNVKGQPRHMVRPPVAEARRQRAKRLAVRAERTRRLLARPYVQARLEAIRSTVAASAQGKSAARARYEDHVRIFQAPEFVDERGREFQTMFGSEDFDCVPPGLPSKVGLGAEGRQGHPPELRKKIEAVKHIVFERLVARLAREPQARLVQARRQLRQVIAQAEALATKQHGTEQRSSLPHHDATSLRAQGDKAQPTRFGREAVPYQKSKLPDVWTHGYEPADKEIGITKRPEKVSEGQRARKQVCHIGLVAVMYDTETNDVHRRRYCTSDISSRRFCLGPVQNRTKTI